MEEIFDLLKRNGLDDDTNIEHKVFHSWSLKQIEKFIDVFDEIIDNQQPNSNISQFSFMPNSNMSAQHLFCNEWHCRLNRIDHLSRFAAFYADSVFIPNYFAYLRHLSQHVSQYENFDFRYNFVGDIKILYKIKPLLKNGIIKLIQPLTPGMTLCPTCTSELSPEFKDINQRFGKNIKVLCNEYMPHTKGTLTLSEELKDCNVYSIDVTSHEDLFDHGGTIFQFEEGDMPKFLFKKTKDIPKDDLKKGITLSREDFQKSHIIDQELHRIIMDLWTKHYLCKTANIDVKYLTNREIDASFINIMTQNEQLRNYNQIVHDNIVCELPILNELPLDTILTIRQNEHDSFLVFRDSINSAIKECLAKDTALTSSIARDIYDDIVQPKLNILNSKFKNIRNSHLRKARQEIHVARGLLTFGIFCLFLAPVAATIPLSIGGAEFIKGIKSISDASATPQELRNDNYFFLWKLINKGK